MPTPHAAIMPQPDSLHDSPETPEEVAYPVYSDNDVAVAVTVMPTIAGDVPSDVPTTEIIVTAHPEASPLPPTGVSSREMTTPIAIADIAPPPSSPDSNIMASVGNTSGGSNARISSIPSTNGPDHGIADASKVIVNVRDMATITYYFGNFFP